MPRLLLLLLAGGLLVLAACGGDNGGSATPTPTTSEGVTPAVSPTAPEDTPTPEFTAPPEFDGTREPVEGAGLGSGTGTLVDVRAGGHEGFDRIVFEFEGALPPYRVEFVSAPITGCASGLEEEVAGDAFLQVRFSPAAAHDIDTGEPTFEPLELTPGLPVLLEAQSVCDFEGVVTWVMGLSEETDFRVFDLEEPYRLAIDVERP